jgi:eukaryotic-like serine/threonine-protein kinase
LKEHLDLGRWPEADELLDRALALPPEEREAFVRRATAHDRALGYALASIVREAERDDGFLEPGGALTGDFGAEVGRALDLQPAAHILTPGNSIEHYEVIELLGRGGMGEVYRARDRRIDREVALKVLLPQFSADPDRLARFRREAQVLAAINHPGIASIYGLAEQDTVRALVLEYVDGVTLAERLESGAMSVTEAVAIARQLAEAIEAAHEAGIIHRDLKPANIILLRGTGDRRAAAEAPALKVLDFGLGKAVAPMRGDTAMHGLTGTSPGVLLGTAAYMSPEQARAETVDERADIWAFGCVVFEMLTGTRAFPGRTAAEVLGNIIEREPAFSLLPVDTPASIRRLLRRSLEKHTSRRLSCVRDAILELDDATLPALEPAVRRPPSIAAFAAGVAALGLLAALLLQTMRRPEPVPEPVARFTVALPAGDMPAIGQQPLVALSPDGRTLVYAARRGEMTALFRRDLATLEPSLIRGTEGGTAPFFSPDGRSLGFVANGELRRIPIAGGAAQTIAAAAGDVTATWTADDGIIFSTSATRVLHRVPASGGAPAALTTLNVARGDRLHLLPQPLPGNDALLFTIVTDSERQVAVLRRKTGDTSILTTGTHARYLPSGHVIFSRDDALWAAPFDAAALTLTGDPVLLLDGVQHSADQVAHLDVSADGSMAYLPAGDYDAMARRISWFDRNGRETPVGLETRPYVGAALSPDGSRIALAIREQGDTDIWIATPSRQTMTQLTAEPANETMPVWSHDGTAVIFQSDRTGNDIYQRDAQGAGLTQRLTEQQGAVNGPHSLTADGRVLLFGLRTAIAAVTPPSTVADTIVSGPAAMVDPRVSPNGRYLAFQSAESGRPDVFVADYPPKGARRWRISPAGGTHPRWGPDSNELFFLDQSGLMVAAVGDNPAMAAAGAARAWARPAPGGEDVVDYDVAPDGKRFLVILSKRSASTAPALIVVRNWLDEVRARLKPPR